MANHQSALKRIRQNEKRRIFNRDFRNRTRTFVKKARASLGSTDLEAARVAVHEAIRELDKNASRGVIHKKNAARRKSRLMKHLAAMESNS